MKSSEKIEPHAELLGKVPDPEVARLADVTTSAVAHYRKVRGIPAACPVGRPRGSGRLAEFVELLGVLTDREVAERAGVTRQAVVSYRAAHGIPRRPR